MRGPVWGWAAASWLVLGCVALAGPDRSGNPPTDPVPAAAPQPSEAALPTRPALDPQLPRPQPTTPARRPLDEYPAFVRPFLKYGMGGAIVAWFVMGRGLVCGQGGRRARPPGARGQARRWIAGMFVGTVLALTLLAVGFLLSLWQRRLDLVFWLAAPLAVILPPAAAALASRLGQRHATAPPDGNGSTTGA
ncbi:MAG TPA: hypothetical protein PKC45_18310 [Gemmatales bacterium]|nr:hypothetical protein [Gemmatales bacterium]